MVKPEWGLKRTCLSCGSRFYDMSRSPIICPKCGAVVDPETVVKNTRRSQSSVPAEPKAPAQVALADDALEADADEVETAGDDEDAAIEDGEEEDGDLMEDASDLGEDDDDMAEVMEHLDENLEDEV